VTGLLQAADSLQSARHTSGHVPNAYDATVHSCVETEQAFGPRRSSGTTGLLTARSRLLQVLIRRSSKDRPTTASADHFGTTRVLNFSLSLQ
jgi:hypothetical protein